MILTHPSYEIWEQKPGLEGIYKQIERAARICYRSEQNIKEGSAKKMVDSLIKSSHLAMLEHGTVYLKVHRDYKYRDGNFTLNEPRPVTSNHYYKLRVVGDYSYITTNYRYIIENKLEYWLKYLCEPTEYHERRITVKFTADIHFYKDTTRHRVFSWAIESTRWCNYMKEKFGMSVSFMKPTWIKEEDVPELEEDCKTIESIYFKWINKGYQAQHAAYFLIQGTKAEVVMTGFVSDYKHFFDLRADGTTGQPHPDVRALVLPLKVEFIERRLI